MIKQLCPDEAKILRYMYTHDTLPMVTLRLVNQKKHGIDIIRNFSNVGELAQCEYPFEVSQYFDNLVCLGLLEFSQSLMSLTKKELYEPLKNHPYIQEAIHGYILQKSGYDTPEFKEGYIRLTDFGKSFCNICLNTEKPEIVIKVNQE